MIYQSDFYTKKSDEDKNENGKYISIDINELIEEIIISPYAKDWFFNIVEDLLIKYNVSKKIKYSDLK